MEYCICVSPSVKPLFPSAVSWPGLRTVSLRVAVAAFPLTSKERAFHGYLSSKHSNLTTGYTCESMSRSAVSSRPGIPVMGKSWTGGRGGQKDGQCGIFPPPGSFHVGQALCVNM